MADDFMNDTNLWDEEVQYDPEAELQRNNLPPDDIKHLMVFKLGPKGFSDPKKDKNGRAFFHVHLQGNVIAPGMYYDNLAAFDNATSIVFEGGTGRLQVWLKAIGQAAPTRCSLGELKHRVEAALASQPQCRVVGRWEWSVPTGETSKTGKDVYKAVLMGMRNADKRADGTPNPIKVIDGVEVSAQFQITNYLPAPAGAITPVATAAAGGDDEVPF